MVAKTCVACGRGTADTPLIGFEFQDAERWICPQDLPLLIHNPAQLIGRLPGAEKLAPADHHN